MSTETVLSGIVSGIIASIGFAIILWLIKPKIKTSDKICVTKQNDKNVYRIKFINNTFVTLINVIYTLHYCVDYEDGLMDIKEIEPSKSKLTTLEKKNFKNTDNAVRITYELCSKYFPLKDNARLIFTIQATHPISNTSICIKTVYHNRDIVFGEFETGKSTNFIMTNRDE